MEIIVNDKQRVVTVLLSNEEKVNERLRKNLQPFYNAYHADKYLVGALESGAGDLTAAMCGLLHYNKTAIVMQQLAAETSDQAGPAAGTRPDGGQIMPI